MTSFDTLVAVRHAFDRALDQATTLDDLERLRVRFLGKKGELTSLLRAMGTLAKEDRPRFGQDANALRETIEGALSDARRERSEAALIASLKAETIDVTMPAHTVPYGARHPLTIVMDDICRVFMGLGFAVADGPEMETDAYNFTKLRLPEDHPARDAHDTFYFDAERLLRTHTSPVQIRTMERQAPPLRIVAPGRVYRSDAIDAVHTPFFHQVEGLAVDEGVTMSDLIGCLTLFSRSFFGHETKIRVRPHHFPFTEPSCEIDIACTSCGGHGDASCRTCRGEGWIEVLGAGMVHPDVLRGVNIDPKRYQGFAFGIGVERTAMGRYGVNDIRRFTDNDLRFLRQFVR